MNVTLALLIVLSVAIAIIVKLVKRTFPILVIASISVIFIFISALAFFTGKAGKTIDVEIWNGQVTGKERERVSCSHSYSCNCRTVYSGSGKDRTSHEECDTCYEHSNDYDWNVMTNVGDLKIDRVDRQGKTEPERWTKVTVGEPASQAHFFTNYIKAAPDSIFHFSDELIAEKFNGKIPDYPKEVYDYYRFNHVLTVGVPVPDLDKWNNDVANILKKLGPSKQANVIILFVNTNDPNYEYALRSKWLGGKKNDIVVILGVTQYPAIDWARVMTWSDKEIFKVVLRDRLTEIKEVNRQEVLTAVDEVTTRSFKRKEMKDFEYLADEIDPPMWVIILAIGVIVLLGAYFSTSYQFENFVFRNFGRVGRRF